MIIAICIVCATIAAKLGYDYRLWLKKKPVNHTLEWLLMVAACAYPIYVFTIGSSLPWYIAAPLAALMVACFIWFTFDGLYNLVRGYNWWYTGTNDKDDARMDNLLQRLKLWQHITLKVVCLAGTITLYILTKN